MYYKEYQSCINAVWLVYSYVFLPFVAFNRQEAGYMRDILFIQNAKLLE